MNGFTITILGQKLKVRFLHPNNKVTICFLNVGMNEFKGVSKCNFDEGDVYDLEEGERFALTYAMQKSNKYYTNLFSKTEDKLLNYLLRQEEGLLTHHANKIKKLNKKGSVSGYENAQNEVPPIEAYKNS